MEPARKLPVPAEPSPRLRSPAPDPRHLEEVLAEIARDVRDQPEAFLDRARVPGGGE